MKRNKINISNKDFEILNKLNKGDFSSRCAGDVLKTLLFNNNFKPFVLNLRKELSIPKDGYNVNNDKDWKILWYKYYRDAYLLRDLITREGFSLNKKYKKQIEDFVERNNILNIHNNLGLIGDDFVINIIELYILANYVTTKENKLGFVSISEYSSDEMEDEIDFKFPASVTKNEMIKYIEENWHKVQVLREKILGKKKSNKRLKISKNLQRDIYIYNLYIDLINKLPKNRESKYIDLEIQKILLDKLKIKLSEGTIRSIISKMKKQVEYINN